MYQSGASEANVQSLLNDKDAMRKINAELGFRHQMVTTTWQIETAVLEEYLSKMILLPNTGHIQI